MPLSPNLRGALFMVVAMVGFTISDALTKYLSETMNIAQIMLARGVFATLMVGLLAWHRGAFAKPRSMLHPLVAVRVAGEASATVAYFIALSHLPIANVSAVQQALPLAVTMGAALFFGEYVGWRRWLAIAVGFAGVLVVVRPGFDGFNAFSLLVLVCVFLCTIRDLSTRKIPVEIPTLLISAVTSLAVTLVGAAMLQPMGGWTPLTLEATVLLAIGAVLLLVGYQFIIMAMRIGDISFISPFRYTALLWAILLGVFLFGDFPDMPMIVGATIIVGSGIYTLYREQIVGRGKAAAESTGPTMAPDGI
ncbi:DMT family transporter [Mesorhizobium sp. A556]